MSDDVESSAYRFRSETVRYYDSACTVLSSQSRERLVSGSLRDAALGSPAKYSLSVVHERRLHQC